MQNKTTGEGICRFIGGFLMQNSGRCKRLIVNAGSTVSGRFFLL